MRRINVAAITILACSILALVSALSGCGGSTKTVTETVEVSTTITEEPAAEGGTVSAVTKFCSSPEADELEVLAAEVSSAINEGNFGRGPRKAIEDMLPIAERAPRGSQCVESAFGTAKAWALNDPDLLREIQSVEQSAGQTLADVREVEREGRGNGE